MLRAVAAGAAILVIGVIVSFAVPGQSSGHGCLHLTVPAATGAQEIDRCGAAARDICATVRAPGSFAPEAEQAIEANCRRAGLRIGP